MLGDAVTVVPGPGLPMDVTAQDANNNLDVVRFDGKTFLGFRTAPSHFASTETRLYIVSSTDEVTWQYEHVIHMSTDLREPRFLAVGGKLHFYFAVLGDNTLDFNPGEMRHTVRGDDGKWSAHEKLYLDGFIPWRGRVMNDTAYLIGYVGGDSIYDFTGEETVKLDIHVLKTTDGVTFTPAFGDQAIISTGGGSETDFAFTEDGGLLAIIRNEAGDEMRWGSKICRAEQGSLHDWKCVADPKKYDSPLVFSHDGHVYLIGRRNLGNGGRYDLELTNLSVKEQTLKYQFTYSEHKKRCALWRVQQEPLDVIHIADLPSSGDTCFASILPTEDDNRYVVYNYTSPLDGPDVGWLHAQLATTQIYRIELTFP